MSAHPGAFILLVVGELGFGVAEVRQFSDEVVVLPAALDLEVSSVVGGSRSRRWVCTAPTKRPDGVSSGGRVTKTIDESAGVSDSRRTLASADATVASVSRMTGSGVIMPPAVNSS